MDDLHWAPTQALAPQFLNSQLALGSNILKDARVTLGRTQVFIPSLLALLCLPEMEKAAAWSSSREGWLPLHREPCQPLQDDPQPVGSCTGMQQDTQGVVCPTGMLWGPP